jgi:hypothetical protein
VVEWIEPELILVFCPAFADALVGRKPKEGFQPLGEVIGARKGRGEAEMPDGPAIFEAARLNSTAHRPADRDLLITVKPVNPLAQPAGRTPPKMLTFSSEVHFPAKVNLFGPAV